MQLGHNDPPSSLPPYSFSFGTQSPLSSINTPELLEALKELMAVCENFKTYHPEWTVKDWGNYKIAQAAIAKAEGKIPETTTKGKP